MGAFKTVRLSECSEDDWRLLSKRSELEIELAMPRVNRIVADVRCNGDRALIKYAAQFDKVKLTPEKLKVTDKEIERAYTAIDIKLINAIRNSADAIRKFHEEQLPEKWIKKMGNGVKAGQLVRQLERVGVYAPGGLAKYPSSMLMAAIPAKVAGVEEIIACTPPNNDGNVDAAVLVAAKEAGVDVVFKVGGAQAIAAMAYGTKTIPKVDKIVGPGNIYVNAAKYAVSKDVEIDTIAGPSEVMIIADSTASANYIVADMIAQAEHDPQAAAVLVTTSEELAKKVVKMLKEAIDNTERWKIVERSLINNGLVAIARDVDEAIRFANCYAPEHLELMVKDPWSAVDKVKNAGSIFIGHYSPVSAGDFGAGPNHILPTGGSARRSSGLSVLDFLKFPTVQELSRDALVKMSETIYAFAEAEGLPGHAESVRERLRERNGVRNT
ncbi:MAG: histidinol dehydrogenase [Candidatus Hadarchaeales archaeon]